MKPVYTDDEITRQVQALAEDDPRKELAHWMRQYCGFPDKPVIEPTYDDTLMALRVAAGGSFYKEGDRLVFFPLSREELDRHVI